MLFDLILYITVDNFSVSSGQVFLGCFSTKQRVKCLAQGRNTVGESSTLPLSHCAPLQYIRVRLEQVNPISQVEHSTIMPWSYLDTKHDKTVKYF